MQLFHIARYCLNKVSGPQTTIGLLSFLTCLRFRFQRQPIKQIDYCAVANNKAARILKRLCLPKSYMRKAKIIIQVLSQINAFNKPGTLNYSINATVSYYS